MEGVTPTRPRSPYGVTKRTCEDLADVYRGLGLSVGALRYFTVYGPRQRPDMAMRRLCEAATGGPPFTCTAMVRSPATSPMSPTPSTPPCAPGRC